MSNRNMETLYRVSVNLPSNTVVMECIGLWCVDNTDAGEYNSLNELPEWAKDRIAVLMTVASGEKIPDIGYRVENTFHIVKSITGETND
tara:strand:+ start:4214 stop:4480 length:267 start_codon:yes stop_codon:yes gene_type:complete